LILLGFVFLSLPEDGQHVIVINNYHGPFVIDMYAIACILVSWICMIITAIVSALVGVVTNKEFHK